MTARWIHRLNESDSRLHKEGVIKQALGMARLDDELSKNFLQLCKDTYNPYVTWGIKQVPESVGIDNAENPWEEFCELLQKLHQRVLTGHAARDAVEAMMYRFDTDEWNTLCRPVLRKDLRAGISDKTLNKILKNTEWEVPVFACQLATSCDDRPEMSGPKRLEPKLDGVRVLMHVKRNLIGLTEYITVTSYSRNGKAFDNFTHIENEVAKNYNALTKNLGFKDSFILDGEVVGESFQALMRQARRKEDVQAENTVFHVFDIIPFQDFNSGRWQAPLEKRIDLLTDMEPIISDMRYVQLLEHIRVDLSTSAGRDQYHRYCQDMVSFGFEGVMIKDLNAPYVTKRSTAWLKYKPTLTVDLPIVALEEGTGRNVGRLGAFICKGVDHGRAIEVHVGSGFSDEERDDFWQNKDHIVGKTVEILCDTISQNQDGGYSLRFPRFVRFRDDK